MIVKRQKYGAKKCQCDGFKFDSLLERDCYLILRNLKEKGVIRSIKLQEKFALRSHTGEIVGRYIADFVVTFPDGSQKVIEAKGRETPVWKWKEKHFRHDYDTPILVIKRQDVNQLMVLNSGTIVEKKRKAK